MPSGLRETSKGHFEIVYEAPWGGVASNASATDIAPSQLVQADGITVRNGVLCFTDVTSDNPIFHLNTLNPPDGAPFNPSDGSYGTLELPLVSITPTDYDARTGIYNGRIYTLSTSTSATPTTGLAVGSVIAITGTTNSVGDYDFNGSDVIDAIIDGTRFHTATPYLSAYTGTPDVTGGEIGVYTANNIGGGFGYIQVQGGGTVAVGAGVAAFGAALPFATGYSDSNSLIFCTPGGAFSSSVQISGVQTSIYTEGAFNSSFADRTAHAAINAPTNWVCMCWTAGANVVVTTVGLFTQVSFTTLEGDQLCFVLGNLIPNTTVVPIPSGYDPTKFLSICGMGGTVPSGQGMQGVEVCNITLSSGVLTHNNSYNDNNGDRWYGYANIFGCFYLGSGITEQAVAGGSAIIVPTGIEETLCLLAGYLDNTNSTTLPVGYDVATLLATAGMVTYHTDGDDVAHGWPTCTMNALEFQGTYADNSGNTWSGGGNFFGVVGTSYTPTPPPSQSWTGLGSIALVFNCGQYLCCVDQLGFSYIAQQLNDGTVQWNFDQVAANGPTLNFGNPTAVKVVQGVAYISVYQTNTLYAYTPGASYEIASQYTAGKYIDIFDEYMLQLNTNSETDGIEPCRVNWSSPDEFGVWDASVNRTAGFNTLTSAQDSITGFIAADNVGYIFRTEGVTQITATGVAIQPFNFTTYWNSVQGQGLLFGATLKQFGRYIFLTTDSGAYIFSAGAFQPISGAAQAAIFKSLNNYPANKALTNDLITAGLSLYPVNDSVPLLEYMIIIPSSYINGSLAFWFYSNDLKSWTSVTKTVAALIEEYTQTPVTTSYINFIRSANIFLNYKVTQYYSNVSNLAVNALLFNVTWDDENGNHTQTFILYTTVDSPTADQSFNTNLLGNLNLVFRQEEIKIYRKPTFRRVVVEASGFGTLALSVNGTSFGSIMLDGTQTVRTYLSPKGIYTGERPQLSIQSTNFNGIIQKVLIAGTYNDGDID